MPTIARFVAQFTPLSAYGVLAGAVVLTGAFDANPMSWSIVLVAAGTFALSVAADGVDAVSEALMATVRHARSSDDRQRAAASWISVSRFAPPTGVVWGLLGWAHVDAAQGALAVAYGVVLAVLALDMQERLAAPDPDVPKAHGGTLLSGLAPVTVLPALAVLGLLVAG